jgi:hypothetical protein
LPHPCAIRVQQSRSAAVIALAWIVHAMIGVANNSSDRSETQTLPTGFMYWNRVSRQHSLGARLNGLLQPLFRENAYFVGNIVGWERSKNRGKSHRMSTFAFDLKGSTPSRSGFN